MDSNSAAPIRRRASILRSRTLCEHCGSPRVLRSEDEVRGSFKLYTRDIDIILFLCASAACFLLQRGIRGIGTRHDTDSLATW